MEEVRCKGWARRLGDIQLPQAGTCAQGEKPEVPAVRAAGGLGGLRWKLVVGWGGVGGEGKLGVEYGR